MSNNYNHTISDNLITSEHCIASPSGNVRSGSVSVVVSAPLDKKRLGIPMDMPVEIELSPKWRVSISYVGKNDSFWKDATFTGAVSIDVEGCESLYENTQTKVLASRLHAWRDGIFVSKRTKKHKQRLMKKIENEFHVPLEKMQITDVGQLNDSTMTELEQTVTESARRFREAKTLYQETDSQVILSRNDLKEAKRHLLEYTQRRTLELQLAKLKITCTCDVV